MPNNDDCLFQGLKTDHIISIRERYGENILSPPLEDRLNFIGRVQGTHFFLCTGIIFCFVTAAIQCLRPPQPYALDNVRINSNI